MPPAWGGGTEMGGEGRGGEGMGGEGRGRRRRGGCLMVACTILKPPQLSKIQWHTYRGDYTTTVHHTPHTHWVHRCHIIQECYQRCPGISIREWGWGKGGAEDRHLCACVCVQSSLSGQLYDVTPCQHQQKPAQCKGILLSERGDRMRSRATQDYWQTSHRHHTDSYTDK